MDVIKRLEKQTGVFYLLAADKFRFLGFDQENYTTLCNCMVCEEPIDLPFYFDYTYPLLRIHKSCAELPGEINVSLHSHQDLKVYHVKFEQLVDYICDVCFTLSPTFKYRCKTCEFNVCFLCIYNHLDDDVVDSQDLKQRVEKLTPYHQHKLQLLYFPQSLYSPQYYQDGNVLSIDGCFIDVVCCCCNKGIQSSGFTCVKCAIFFHEFCPIKIPKRFRSIIHPDHDLLPRNLKLERKKCNACREGIRGVELGCGNCDCCFHVRV